MERIREIVTQTEIENSTNELKIVLRPISSRGVNNFREKLENNINSQNTLPYMTEIENIRVIADETIRTINNSTSSERRIEFMQSVINHKNI